MAHHDFLSVDGHDESAKERVGGPNEMAAEARILAVLGEDGGADNLLARTLRSGGVSLSAIREALADKVGHGELREEVELVLARRMEELLSQGGHFHKRVQANAADNRIRVEPRFGYLKDLYPSDEYVVLLAMAKLDGSFNTFHERNLFDLPADHEAMGQHRQASDTLIESFVKENARETIST